MAYKLDKTGTQVEADLNAVEKRTIYPLATKTQDGLMPKEQMRKIEEIDTGDLSDEEIRIICI